MPVFDVELSDGRTVTLESDQQPDESQILSALTRHQDIQSKPSIGERALGAIKGLASTGALGNLEELGSAFKRGAERISKGDLASRAPSPEITPPEPSRSVSDSLAAGGFGLGKGFYGLGSAGLTGLQAITAPFSDTASDFFKESAREADRRRQEIAQIESEEVGGPGALGTLSEGAMSLLPAVAAGPLGGPAVIAASGLQQGASTLRQAQDEYERMGVPESESLRKSLLPAAVDALQTAAITAVAGKLLGPGAEGLTMPAKRQAIQDIVGRTVKGAGGEALEEGAQQFISDYVVGRMSYNPDMNFDEALKGAVKAAMVGGVLGGGVNVGGEFIQNIQPKNAGENVPPVIRDQKIAPAGSLSIAQEGQDVTSSKPEAQAPQKVLTAAEIREQPAGTLTPEQIEALPNEQFRELVIGPGKKWQMTPDATAWAMNQEATPELIAEVRRKRDEEDASALKKLMAGDEHYMSKSQWYSDALHVLENDEVGQINRKVLQREAEKGTINLAPKTSLPVKEAAPTPGTTSTSRKPTELSGEQIGEMLGAEFRGTVGRNKTLYQFEAKNPDGTPSTSFSVPVGATPEQARAKYEEVRQRYAEDQARMPRAAPVPEGAAASQGRIQTHDLSAIPDHEQAVNLVSLLEQAFPGANPTTVVRSYRELPDSAFAYAYSRGSQPWQLNAFIDQDGHVYINSSMMNSLDDVRSKWMHEQAVHFSARREMGDKFSQYTTQVEESFRDHPLMGTIRKNYQGASPAELGEEFLAHIAENPQEDPTAWQKIVATFRQWLRDIGFVATVTENDIKVLLNGAIQGMRKVRSGEAGAVSGSIADPEPDDQMADLGLESTALDPATGLPIPPRQLPGKAPRQKRHQVAGAPEIGSKYTPENIRQTQQSIRDRVFDGTRPINQQTTDEAWNLLNELTNPDTRQQRAQEIKNITGAEMGPGLLTGELWNYALKLARKADTTMLDRMIRSYTDIEQMGTGGGGFGTAGRSLRSAGELASNPLWKPMLDLFKDQRVSAARALKKIFGREDLKLIGEKQLSAVVDVVKTATDSAMPEAGQLELDLGKIPSLKQFLRDKNKPSPGQLEAMDILDRYAKTQSDTPSFDPKTWSSVRETFKGLLNGDVTHDEFRATLDSVKVPKSVSEPLIKVAMRELQIRKAEAFRRAQEKQSSDLSRAWNDEVRRMTEQGQRTADQMLDTLEKRNSGAEWLKPGNRNRVRDIVKAAFKSTEPVLENPVPWVSNLTSELVDAGVTESVARRLATEVAQSRETQWVNARLRTQERAGAGMSLRSLIEDIRLQPQRAQDAQWLKETAERWFMSQGLSREQAVQAASRFGEAFKSRLGEARAKVAERALSSRGIPAPDQLISLIRSGDDWVQKLAEKEGWRPISKEDSKKLADLEAVATNPETLPHARAKANSEMYRILQSKASPDVIKELASFYSNNALSGTGTSLLNMLTPGANLITRAVNSGMRSLVDAGGNLLMADIPSLVISAKGLIEGMKGIGSEFKFAFKNDAYTLRSQAEIEKASNLYNLMERGHARWSDKSLPPTERAKGLVQMIASYTDVVRIALSSMDQAWGSAMNTMFKTEAGYKFLKDAGISENEARQLMLDTFRKSQQYYEQARARGLNGNDAVIEARDRVMRDLNSIVREKAGARAESQMDEYSTKEAELELGVHQGEGGLSNTMMKWIEDLRRRNPLLYRMIMGFPRVGFNMFHRGAWFSPYGWKRLGQDYWARQKGNESQYEQSLSTEMQRRQRLAETISGTIGWALLVGLWFAEKDKPEKDKTIHFNWDMPQNAQGRAQWIAQGKKPYTLGIKVPGTNERALVNWNRGGLETLGPAIGTIAAMENARQNGRDMSIISEIPNYAGLVFAPYGARRDYFTERGAAQAVGHKLSPFIPFSGALRTFNKVADTRDTTSFRGAALSSIPVVGAFTGHPALNFYGDPVSDRPASWSFRLGLPINVTLPESPDNEKAYGLIQQKGVIPTFPTRSQTEKKYGPLTDEQWYEWRKGVGAEIKSRVMRDYDALAVKTPKNVKAILDNYQDIGETRTAARMKLKEQQ